MEPGPSLAGRFRHGGRRAALSDERGRLLPTPAAVLAPDSALRAGSVPPDRHRRPGRGRWGATRPSTALALAAALLVAGPGPLPGGCPLRERPIHPRLH